MVRTLTTSGLAFSMMTSVLTRSIGMHPRLGGICLWLLVSLAMLLGCARNDDPLATDTAVTAPEQPIDYQPRVNIDASGFMFVAKLVPELKPDATLKEISDAWKDIGQRTIDDVDRVLASNRSLDTKGRFSQLLKKATVLNNEGDPKAAYEVVKELRAFMESDRELSRERLYSIIFLQGVTALRMGENDNCILCRGESSCILPISPAAVHTNPKGSRLAIQHFQEILTRFPDDLDVRWLLNLAYMTLGEYPDKVDPKYLISLTKYTRNEFDIGRFRDIGAAVGINKLNQAGGAIMEDFDNDGLLDIVVTTMEASSRMTLFHNTGQGTFEDITDAAGLTEQLGGLNCVQTDFNNDGQMDILVIRGAWFPHPTRPSLLRNDGQGAFTDVTREAGLDLPVNSIAAQWADYDNDGWLDLFVCCERQRSRLYHNLKNGSFEEVALEAGVTEEKSTGCKGVAWIDYDNDNYPDLFQSYFLPDVGPRLFHNERNGTFREVTDAQGISGPVAGFACWAWDFDNDGWLDIFSTCYDHSLSDVVRGLIGEPHHRNYSRLYRNQQGQGFVDVAKEAGLDMVLATMGSNFADLDNDGYLDMYLGTGEPNIATLVPNRMFKNVGGKRFADITASSGTGNLQKGHGVACGDWDRDGNTDIFIEMGGAIKGDKYHNILFQNPGHNNAWLAVKLTGQQTNRPAIGARVKIVTAGKSPQTIHRQISSGSSFGANSTQQTIGLGTADRIALLEIQWPASGTTQRFENLAVNQSIAITEFAEDFQPLDCNPIPHSSSTPAAKLVDARR